MFNEKVINQLVEDAKEVWPLNWPDVENYFNKSCFSISVDIIMRHLGLFQKKGDFETFDSIKQKINIFKDAEYVFCKMLEVLCEEKIIEKKDSGFICLITDPDIEAPAEYLVSVTRKIPDEGAPFQWLARAYGGLVHFIKGKIYGEEVMFPFNDFSLVEDVYYTSKVYNFWSILTGKAVKRIIDEKYNKKITVMEVGAGTGNGTYNVFKNTENIEKKFEKYIFTDISKALIKKAGKSERFNKYDFIEYKPYDLTKELKEQDFEEEFADIVLAVNVLHATKNLTQSCKALHKLVKKDGYVILGEIAPPLDGLYRYMELTFGLLASYYNYDDKELRPNSPIIRSDKWIELFQKAGFSEVIAIPGNKLQNCDRGGIIIAKK
ncbi:MAG: class I SAM-dependent methyltransferase [Spirochaetes bacterium]|nr:class I SAM-dependent methyltransferase [Spirochaetota bacterium]